jgi:hypothetical protein
MFVKERKKQGLDPELSEQELIQLSTKPARK